MVSGEEIKHNLSVRRKQHPYMESLLLQKQLVKFACIHNHNHN